MSDLHLGTDQRRAFLPRVWSRQRLDFQPDMVFIPGDFFDGTKGDLDQLVAPFRALTPPLGIYFSTGNHEEFTSPTQYIEAITTRGHPRARQRTGRRLMVCRSPACSITTHLRRCT